MPRATRADVAKLAGVSPATVSHVLNGRAEEIGVAAATVQKVKDAATQLAYIPRATGRNLRASTPRAIGLFLSEAPTPANIPLLNHIVLPAIEQARKHSMFAVPFFPARQNNGGQTSPVTAHDVLSEIDLRAAIIEVDDSHVQLGHDLARQDVPIIWMNTRGEPASFSGAASLGIDETCGVKEALEPLTHGNQKLLIIKGPSAPNQRCQTAAELFEPNVVTTRAHSWTEVAGFTSTKTGIESNPDVSVVFAPATKLADGATYALQILNRPDIHLVGYGSELSALATAGSHGLITDIHWPLEDMTRKAITIASATDLRTEEIAEQITFRSSVVRPA